ncbi:pyrroline-5-carboxylate reductase [Halalkalibacter urbisdiaboli]|uniref:pyrroline-5-carboxylate reductase n=1 Tax=Halalkalibacter urbisdiaboli TaxID=1960589 RepID=UPI000B4339AA|nr:pyrroline-5-carboxylate reductase [Halalkalibacter urbisdiaboli]
MIANKIITFLGAGSMAEAIIAGLVSHNIVKPSQIIATNLADKQKLEELQQRYGIQTTSNRKEAVEKADIVILAMKPKSVNDAISEVRERTSVNQLFISVLAGITTAYIEDLLGHQAPVIRTMPNTSAKVGASATAICRGEHASDIHVEEAATLFAAVGTVSIVHEDKIDAVTGIAGSGPAYFYFLVEAMEKAAAEAGLTKEEASAFITQTIVGVGKRLQTTTKTSRELYEEVMSPNGTTEAGINVLREHHTQEAVQEAITKAIARAKELGAILTETKS